MGARRAGRDEARVLGEEFAQGLNVAGDDGVRRGFEAGVGGFEMAGELGPVLKAMGLGDEQLRVGQVGAFDAGDFFPP